MWQILRGPILRPCCELCEFGQVSNVSCLPTQVAVYWPQSHRVTESQSYKHPRVPSIQVGEIFFVPDFNKLPYLLCSQGGKKGNKYNKFVLTKITSLSRRIYYIGPFLREILF